MPPTSMERGKGGKYGSGGSVVEMLLLLLLTWYLGEAEGDDGAGEEGQGETGREAGDRSCDENFGDDNSEVSELLLFRRSGDCASVVEVGPCKG